MANMHRGKNYVPTLERGNDKKGDVFEVAIRGCTSPNCILTSLRTESVLAQQLSPCHPIFHVSLVYSIG